MSPSIIDTLSDYEKDSLFKSAHILDTHLNKFVNQFFDRLIKTNAGDLFNTTDIIKLKQKFESSLKIILLNIKYPTNMNDFINILITKHIHTHINSIQIDSFFDSFILTLKDFQNENFTDRVIKVWEKFLAEIMNLFRRQLA